jgi:hypothetical protein
MNQDPNKIRYIWLSGEVVKDRLTSRESRVYGAINFLGIVLIFTYVACAFWFNILVAQFWHLVFIVPAKVPVVIFGLALRTDTRVIHGVKWLREGNNNT